jgi:hypothetical protein
MCSRKVNFFNLKFNIKLILLFLNFLSLDLFSQTTFTVTLNTPGSSSWIVPCGVTSITVQCWGGGGAGGSVSAAKSSASGGGGGGYSTSAFSVSAGSVITYTVGSGGLVNSSSSGGAGSSTIFSTLSADGGTGGQGGSTTGSYTVVGTGGAGSTNSGSNGSSASGSGNTWNGGAGGNAGNTGAGGGTGGGGSTNANGNNGNNPGGGGSGASLGTGQPGLGAFGGSGGNGQINIIYTVLTTVNAGADQNLATCSTTSTTLNATSVSSPWSGAWSCSGCSNITITNSNSPTSTVSGTGFTAGSSTAFIWTVTNGTCSYTDEVVINVPACAQANPECASATTLTIDASLLCGQNTNGFGGVGDGCTISGSGQTVWYKFTVPAATTSLVLNLLGTSSTLPHFGLYSGSCAGLTCTQNIIFTLNSGDPGKHILLSSLTAGATYFVQVQSGSSTLNSQFCISVNNVANNSIAPANALLIDDCGVTYNGTTNGGYYPSGTSTGSNNLDGATTTATGVSETGDDVSFVVNNISWFKFCSVNAGTYNVQFDVVSCVFTGTSSGSQMAILRGTDNSMTNIWQATNPTQPATPIQTSPSFTLAANGCAYLVVDGFAGDACTYSYVLTETSGSCRLLPIELFSLNAVDKNKYVEITWATSSEINNDYFEVEKSTNGVDFFSIERIEGSGMSANAIFYSAKDYNPSSGVSYYRIKQVDFDGKFSFSKIISITRNASISDFLISPNPANENMNISFNSEFSIKANVQILNYTGSKILSFETNIIKGENIIPVEIKDIESGIYIIKISGENSKDLNAKFIKN